MADEKRIQVGLDPSGMKSGTREMLSEYDKLLAKTKELENLSGRAAKKEQEEIKKTIELLEQKNRLLYEKRVSTARSDYQEAQQYIRSSGTYRPGEIAGAEQAAQSRYKAEMSNLGQQYQQEREQTKLLRELIDTVRQTSKEEIREEAKNSERTENTVQNLPSEDKPEKGRKRISNKDVQDTRDLAHYIKTIGGQPANVLGAKDAGGVVTSVTGGISGVLSNLTGAVPIIGSILADFIGKGVTEMMASGTRVEDALSERAKFGLGRYHGGQSDIFNVKEASGFTFDKGGLAGRGMDIADYQNTYNELRSGSKYFDKSWVGMYYRDKNFKNHRSEYDKYLSTQVGFGESTNNLMNIIQGTTAGKENVINLLGLKRYGGGNVSGEVEFFRKYLDKTQQDSSVLPEILQQFTAATKELVAQTGKAETTRVASLIGGFSSATGFKGDLLASNFSTMEKGFQRSDNSVIQAMQFRAAREAGAKTFWQAEKMMASPFAEGNEAYVINHLKNIRQVSGEGENYERAISNAFKIAPNLAASVAKWRGEGYDPKKQKAFFDALREGKDFQPYAEGATGYIKETAKKIEIEKQDRGFNAAKGLSKKVGEIVVAMDKLLNAFTGEKFKSVIDDLNGYVPANILYTRKYGDPTWTQSPITEKTAQELSKWIQQLATGKIVVKLDSNSK